jgi:hypothetical protein
MTSWRNSARAGDSIRDFIFDFGSGKDSTTVLPSHMLIEPCSFWAAAKPSNFSSPVPVNGTERLAEDVRISKASGDPVHFKKEKPNLLDALKPGDRVMFRVEYHRKLDGTEKDVSSPRRTIRTRRRSSSGRSPRLLHLCSPNHRWTTCVPCVTPTSCPLS